jgi:hypothetical protein
MFEPYLRQIDFELFGDQHRHRRIGALSHLDLVHDQDNLAVTRNADESIRRETGVVVRVGAAGQIGQADAQEEPATRSGTGCKNGPARNAARCFAFCVDFVVNCWIEHFGQPFCGLVAGAIDACLMASRIRT